MAIFTRARAFRDTTPIGRRPAGGGSPAAQPQLVATWLADDNGRLVRRWRPAV
jgi:hypothetical protein